MTQSSGGTRQLYQELWISFTALLKAYAAAASFALPGNATEVKDREDSGLEICTAAKALHFSFDCQSGSGQWSVSPAVGTSIAPSGSFHIDEDGKVNLDDSASSSPLEMDAAAEVLIARIL